jgi:hypothetical protein
MLLIKFILVFTFKKHSHVALRNYIAFDRRQLQLSDKKIKAAPTSALYQAVLREPHHVDAAPVLILLYKDNFFKTKKFDIRVEAIFLLILYD